MNQNIYFYYPNPIPAVADSKSGLDCWVLKTYRHIRHLVPEGTIELTDTVFDSGIFIFHKGFFPPKLKPSKYQYFVCIQADYGRYRHAQYHIHQNPSGPGNFKFSKRAYLEDGLFTFTRNSFIPHWNQDHLIKRDKERGRLFENVFFMGLRKNFSPELLSQEFSERLAKMDISLKVITESSQWNDYSKADLVLSVRDFSGKPHYNKPSTKIINAMLAGVPVISGAESSAIYLKDRFAAPVEIADSKESCIAAILRIRENYSDYLNAIAEVNTKLSSYHDKGIADSWCRTLKDIRSLYHKWHDSGVLYRKLFYSFSSI